MNFWKKIDFCIFLENIVWKINLCNLTCELRKLTKLWLIEGLWRHFSENHVFQNGVHDQLTRNFKYAFSTCVTMAPTRINQKILFWDQTIATFLITDFFLLLWYLLQRFFFLFPTSRIMDSLLTTFFISDYVRECVVPLILTFFVPKNLKTSLKYVRTNLVNLTGKGIIVPLQKIP